MFARSRRVLGVVLGLAMLTAACGNPLDTIATIDGEDVFLENVTMLRPSYDEEIDATTDRFRSDLTFVISQQLLITAAADEFGISVSEAEISQWLAEPPARHVGTVDNVRSNADLAEFALRLVAEAQMIRDAVTIELVRREGFAATVLDATPEQFRSACVSHILVATAEEAEGVLARVEAGEDFAAVAIEVSTDPGSAALGGRLGEGASCMRSLASYVNPFGRVAANAPIGVPVGPVETSFGFHVLRVEERLGPETPADLEADPEAYIDAALVALYDPWASERMDAADIRVDPLIGQWMLGSGVTSPDA